MWMTAEDARSDFILAAAAALFGPLLRGFVAQLPGYPETGPVADALAVAWLFAMTGLVPLLLVRYRQHGLGAFGLDQPRGSLGTGLVTALPLVVTGWLTFWALGLGPVQALLGWIGLFDGVYDTAVTTVQLVVAFVGSLLLFTFLTVRARDAFRATDVSQVEALRTFGMGAAGVAAVLGLLVSIRGGLGANLLRVAGVAALVLMADRLVEPGRTTTRATILGPAITALVLAVFRSGGLFSGNLMDGLYLGTLAGTVAIVVATLVETRRYAWACVPIVAAAVLYGYLGLM